MDPSACRNRFRGGPARKQLINKEETAMLPAPGFHHIHLNSLDPDAAIAF